MELLLLPGLAFWSTIAFVGTRKMFAEGRGPLCDPLGRVKQDWPWLLPTAAGVLLSAGLLFVLREIQSIRDHAGFVGGFWMVAFLCGIAGAIALAAHLSLQRS